MKTFLLVILTMLFFASSNAQLPNHNMRLIKHLNPRGGSDTNSLTVYYAAIWGYKAPNGREYAILGARTGTSFVDITDTNNIYENDFVPGPASDWREMKTYSHYAYVVTDVTSQSVGLQIIDLQYLPDSVRFVTNWTYNVSFKKIHTISQEGPYLYLNGGDAPGGGIVVVDVTNPTAPVFKSAWNQKYVHDCRVRNDTIFAANIYTSDGGTISVINATNKSNLVTITGWANNPFPGPHNTALTTDRQYCLVTDEINEGTGVNKYRKLKIWNISNLNNPTLVSTWQPTGINPYGDTSTIVHNVEVYGNYAIIGHYEAGLRVVNITNPALPVEVAWWDTFPKRNRFTYNGCWGAYMFPSGKIIASDRQTGLYVMKTLTPITGVETSGSHIPEKYSLHQNYPNPFNPSTTIEFDLPVNGYVALKVFDLSGKEVANVINGYRKAGSYQYVFDAGQFGLTSGAYFYKLETPNYSETKKMLLIK